MRQWIASFVALLVRLLARLVTAARPIWQGVEPLRRQRIYFANHASHGDFVLVWMTLPPRLRQATRPVAGADYWLASRLRRFLIHDVFHAVLVERSGGKGCADRSSADQDSPDQDSPDQDSAEPSRHDPLAVMNEALGGGDSLILFPEGTRNTTDDACLPFKSGLYHLAKAHPEVELVPVWIANLNRVLPKGEVVPIPLLCTVTYGAPVALAPDEDKDAFLVRAREALLALAPAQGGANAHG
ncbi:lysophospholipid acyltransferase family protein [Halomonas sp. V046]|uniref:lysophospholipid acyltransferase family protein n=1 Tax=Halomonas sp. V046 TaxID=3459611 RepID=UPI0040442A71